MNDVKLNLTENNEYLELEHISLDGQKYIVGYPKSAGYTLESLTNELSQVNLITELENKDDFNELEWVPNSISKTSTDAQHIGIKSGEVIESPHIYFKYRINFINTKGWKFYFKDKSGDVYSCRTFRYGPHYIDFNSEQPTIIGVK